MDLGHPSIELLGLLNELTPTAEVFLPVGVTASDAGDEVLPPGGPIVLESLDLLPFAGRPEPASALDGSSGVVHLEPPSRVGVVRQIASLGTLGHGAAVGHRGLYGVGETVIVCESYRNTCYVH